MGRAGAYLVSVLYVIRCGLVAESPRVVRRHSWYSLKFPWKKVTLDSPSKARMWLVIPTRTEALRGRTLVEGGLSTSPELAPVLVPIVG
jgi:hypothetical protein